MAKHLIQFLLLTLLLWCPQSHGQCLLTPSISNRVRTYSLESCHSLQQLVIPEDAEVTTTILDGYISPTQQKTIDFDSADHLPPLGSLLKIAASNVTIKNLTIRVSRATANGAIFLLGSNITLQNVTLSLVQRLENQFGISVGQPGLVATPLNTVKIENSNFKGAFRAAVNINALGVSQVSIDHCNFDGVYIGLLTNTRAKDLYDVAVRRSVFRGIKDSAFQINHPVYNLEQSPGQLASIQEYYPQAQFLQCLGTNVCVNGNPSQCISEAFLLANIGSCGTTPPPHKFYFGDNDITMEKRPPVLDPNNGICIAIAGARDVKIIGNRLHSCIYNGIHLEDEARDIWIRDNVITKVTGYSDASGERYSKNTSGIWAKDTRDVIALNNTIGPARDCGIHLFNTCGFQMLSNPITASNSPNFSSLCYKTNFEADFLLQLSQSQWPEWTTRCQVQ